MIREIDDMAFSDKGVERILVCITAQGNSKRLIDRSGAIADKYNGELHILHVQRGDSIFNNQDTPKLLEELFNYGSEKGGMIHFYCDEDVPQCIGRFVKDTGITKIVFGQPPMGEFAEVKAVFSKLNAFLEFVPENVELIVIPRDDNMENICLERK